MSFSHIGVSLNERKHEKRIEISTSARARARLEDCGEGALPRGSPAESRGRAKTAGGDRHVSSGARQARRETMEHKVTTADGPDGEINTESSEVSVTDIQQTDKRNGYGCIIAYLECIVCPKAVLWFEMADGRLRRFSQHCTKCH